MTDHDLERLLARYRPISRLLALPTTRSARTWPWAVAAAALLAITVGLDAPVAAEPDASPAVDFQRVERIADELGGNPESRVTAEWIVRNEARLEQEARVARRAAPPEIDRR